MHQMGYAEKVTPGSSGFLDPSSLTPPGTSSSANISNASTIEKSLVPHEEQKPPRDVHGFLWALVVISILSTTFLFGLDNTIVADVQPAIVERFGAISKLPWLSVAFLVGAASTNLIWGKMYAQFDAKFLYLLTTFLFEAGSAICGAAPTMDALIVGRAICGLGGSGMYTGVLTLLSVTTTEHERPTYIGFTGLSWGLGTVLGPIIGGAFADSSATWRWAFYINLCVGGIFVPVWIFLLPRFDPRPNVALKRRFAEIDYLGTLLMIGAFVSGVMAISFGGNVYSWNSGRIIGLFVCSGILFILFGIQQTFAVLTTKERRIFPIQFIKSKIMLVLFAETSAASTACFVPIYFIPLLFQFVRSDSALESGVRLMPYVVFLVVMCVANGAIMSSTGYYFPWYIGCGIFTVVGSALMYTVDEHSGTGSIYGYSILLGIGSGGFVQASFSVAQAKVEPRMIPIAIGFITAAQLGGAAIALSIANSVFLNESSSAIGALLPDVPAAQIQATISGAGSDLLKTLTVGMREEVSHAIVHAMSKVYIMDLVAGLVAILLALLMKPGDKLFIKGAVAA